MIDDTLRLDYLLKLLNLGGTDALLKIAPGLGTPWDREQLDFYLKEDLKTVRADLQVKLKELGEQKYAIEREMQKICKQIEQIN